MDIFIENMQFYISLLIILILFFYITNRIATKLFKQMERNKKKQLNRDKRNKRIIQ